MAQTIAANTDGSISAFGKARATIKGAPLSAEDRRLLDAIRRDKP